MSELLDKTSEQLEKMSKITFLLNKKEVVQNVMELLHQTEQKMESDVIALSADLERVKQHLKQEKDRYDDLEEEFDDVQRQLKKAKNSLNEAEQENSELNAKIGKKEAEIDHLLNSWKQERTASELRDKLVSALISAENENEHLKTFDVILNNDFLKFAAEENALSNEAQALLLLQEIGEELKIISSFPEFHSAQTVAVAGGFSAGKSEFISSLFSDSVLKLPSSIEPTTAIPTYVINSNNKEPNRLIGINNNSSTVDLLTIDPELVGKLNHQFMRSFNFPLKKIMPYMLLTTKMDYEHICFVDTPGYNPSSSQGSHTADDEKIAREFVDNANALIWVIGADVNGTIPRTDVQFLKNILGESGKPLYFVLNKADLRAKEDVQRILQEFKRVLEQENLNYLGISAYSSILRQEIDYIGGKLNLSAFLAEMNRESDKQTELLEKLYTVDQMYQYAILKEIKERKKIQKDLDDIALELNMANFGKGKGTVYENIDDIVERFSVRTEQAHLKTLEFVIQKFRETIEAIFGKPTAIQRPIISIDDIPDESNDDEEVLEKDVSKNGKISKPKGKQETEREAKRRELEEKMAIHRERHKRLGLHQKKETNTEQSRLARERGETIHFLKRSIEFERHFGIAPDRELEELEELERREQEEALELVSSSFLGRWLK